MNKKKKKNLHLTNYFLQNLKILKMKSPYLYTRQQQQFSIK